jgi:transcriptional regulator with XRE-family HTH domain/DNA-directed RNA polymerase subunit RPC12/RpoP
VENRIYFIFRKEVRFMDQEKIGKFIAACRKERGLTQAVLAEKLGITDRAVSKWERGKGLPDVSLMPELCGILKININELFTGERLAEDQYEEMAEQHLLEMHRQEELTNKKLLSLETVIGYMSSSAFLMMIFAASFAVTRTAWRIALIAVGCLIFIVGMVSCLKLEHDVGYYKCPECGATYVPTMKAVIFAPHIGRSRKMRCPYCGKRAYHKKVLTK